MLVCCKQGPGSGFYISLRLFSPTLSYNTWMFTVQNECRWWLNDWPIDRPFGKYHLFLVKVGSGADFLVIHKIVYKKEIQTIKTYFKLRWSTHKEIVRPKLHLCILPCSNFKFLTAFTFTLRWMSAHTVLLCKISEVPLKCWHRRFWWSKQWWWSVEPMQQYSPSSLAYPSLLFNYLSLSQPLWPRSQKQTRGLYCIWKKVLFGHL